MLASCQQTTLGRDERMALVPAICSVVRVVRSEWQNTGDDTNLVLHSGFALALSQDEIMITQHQLASAESVYSLPHDIPAHGTLWIRGQSQYWSILNQFPVSFDLVKLRLTPGKIFSLPQTAIDFVTPLEEETRVFLLSCDEQSPSLFTSASKQKSAGDFCDIRVGTVVRLKVEHRNEADPRLSNPAVTPFVLLDEDEGAQESFAGRSGSPIAVIRAGKPVIVGILIGTARMTAGYENKETGSLQSPRLRTVLLMSRAYFRG